jgi:hypothetical protein
MSRLRITAVLVVAFAQPLVAQPSSARRPGSVVGRVIDSRGQPLVGVKGDIEGSLIDRPEKPYGSILTEKDGRYAVRMPDGRYQVATWRDVTYNGKQYRLGLDPTDSASWRRQESAQGIVADFVWRIAGKVPSPLQPGKPKAFYGGFIYLYATDPMSKRLNFPPGSFVEVRLTPTGPLIDGSEGKPLTIRREVGASGMYIGDPIVDIPIGRYTMVAELVERSSARTALQLVAESAYRYNGGPGQYQRSIAIDFPPARAVPRPYRGNGVEGQAVYLSR